MRILAVAIGAATLAACVPTTRTAVIVPDAGPTKRISREGGQLVLPDGTRVTQDARGGFALPNGDYVARDGRGALVLPTGARCLPDTAGYTCP